MTVKTVKNLIPLSERGVASTSETARDRSPVAESRLISSVITYAKLSGLPNYGGATLNATPPGELRERKSSLTRNVFLLPTALGMGILYSW